MRPIVTVISENLVEDDIPMSTTLVIGWLKSAGCKVKILTDQETPKWKKGNSTFTPPEILLTTVMPESDVDEITVSGWWYNNIEALLERVLHQMLGVRQVQDIMVTLRNPLYSEYSADELLITTKVSIFVY